MLSDKFLGAVLITMFSKHDTYMHLQHKRLVKPLAATGEARHFTTNSAAPSWFQDWCCAYPWPPGIGALQTMVMDERREGSWRIMEDDDFQRTFRKSQHSQEKALKFFRCTQGHLQHNASSTLVDLALGTDQGPGFRLVEEVLGRWIQSKLSSDWSSQSTKPSW